jgi:hypothetical protein
MRSFAEAYSPLLTATIPHYIIQMSQNIRESSNPKDVTSIMLLYRVYLYNNALKSLFVKLGFDIKEEIFKETVTRDRALEEISSIDFTVRSLFRSKMCYKTMEIIIQMITHTK